MLPKLREPPEAYSEVASVAAVVQRNINAAAGIGFNGITGKIDRSRVGNLLAKLTGGEYEKTKWLLGEAAMASVTRSAVTDTIRENAKFHKEAGIHPYLRRYSRGKCCDWCDSMQGAWEYGEQPDDFWRDPQALHLRHRVQAQQVQKGGHHKVRHWGRREDAEGDGLR